LEALKTFRVYNGGIELVFGPNSLAELRRVLASMKRPVIVTGSRSARESGALGEVARLLDESGVGYVVYDKAKPNPTVEEAEDLARFYEAEDCGGFIAIGGGSVIDLAKSARALVAGGGRMLDYFYGVKQPPRVKPTLVAVNLTHGTGSEADRFAVLTHEAEVEKRGFPAGYPDYSVDDPRYTLTLPINQSIYTSVDALSHVVEASTSRLSNPFVEAIAVEAAEKIFANLPRVVENPRDLEARYWLLYASMLGGVAIDHALTHLGHGLEHLLSAYNPRLPHGAGLAIIHSKLIEEIYRARPLESWRILSNLDPSLRPRPEDAGRAGEAFRGFLARVGFKETLGDYGFMRGEVERLFKMILVKESMRRYIDLAPFKVGEELLKKIASSLV
jgi:alcohol dehydrogenase